MGICSVSAVAGPGPREWGEWVGRRRSEAQDWPRLCWERARASSLSR